MAATSELKLGDWVRVAPFANQPEEYGTIVGGEVVNGTLLTVTVRLQPTRDPDDDGVREVPIEQVALA